MAKKSKVITLRVSKQKLADLTGYTLPKDAATPSSAAPSPAPTPNDSNLLKPADSVDQASESASTPAPLADGSAPTDLTKKRKGPAPGAKRALAQNGDGTPKPRGKPGPKKKPRNEDGTIDHTTKPGNAAGAGHKLGPKTNAGAINANLRALDRSGKPCRKWTRKPFSVKSFTGVSWELPSWKGGEKCMLLPQDDSSSTKDISQLSSSEAKPNNDSDVAMSNTGDGPADTAAMSTPAASSPPAAPAAPAVIAAQG